MDNKQLNNLVTGCAKIKIKDGMLSRVYEWQKYINDNKEGVLQSLRQEGVFVESVFLEKSGDDNYLVYYMKLQDHEKAKAAFNKSELNVDRYHAKFKQEAWGERKELEMLIDFINPDLG